MLVFNIACANSISRATSATDVLWRENRRLSGFAVSPDGRLFLASGGLVLYADGPGYSEWRPVAAINEIVIDLVAPTRDAVFLILRGSVLRYSFAGGNWRESASLPPTKALSVLDSWASDSDDFYVVGDGAAIVHFDGRAWIREPNPLDSIAKLPSPQLLRSGLWAIGANAKHGSVFATSWDAVIERRNGVWIDRGARTPADSTCRVTALILAPPNDPRVVGFEPSCIYTITSKGWGRSNPEMLTSMTGSGRSRIQPDGTTVLWALRTANVLRFRADGVKRYRLPDVHGVAGIAIVGDYLFAAGILKTPSGPEESAIVRAPLALIEQKSVKETLISAASRLIGR